MLQQSNVFNHLLVEERKERERKRRGGGCLSNYCWKLALDQIIPKTNMNRSEHQLNFGVYVEFV